MNPYFQVQSGGSVDSALDIVPPSESTGTSGEIRLARKFVNGVHTSDIELAIRGRATDRQFGGDQIDDFGTVALFDPTHFPQPPLDFGPVSHDLVHQLDVGLTFEELWRGLGSVAIGALKDHYERTVQVPGAASESSKEAPWRMNGPLHLRSGSKDTDLRQLPPGARGFPAGPPSQL